MPKTRSTEKLYSAKKVQLVFISGVAGSGKTEIAKYLTTRLNKEYDSGIFSAMICPLAEPIKEIAYWNFGWDGNKDEKGRRLLQVLGADAGRNYNPTIWIEKLQEKIENQIVIPSFVFIDDWRFPNEESFFRTLPLYEITKIRVCRNIRNFGEVTYQHESEQALPEIQEDVLEYSTSGDYNFSVLNNRTLPELYSKLDNILAYLKTKLVLR